MSYRMSHLSDGGHPSQCTNTGPDVELQASWQYTHPTLYSTSRTGAHASYPGLRILLKISKTCQICFFPRLAGAESKLPSLGGPWAHPLRAAPASSPHPPAPARATASQALDGPDLTQTSSNPKLLVVPIQRAWASWGPAGYLGVSFLLSSKYQTSRVHFPTSPGLSCA